MSRWRFFQQIWPNVNSFGSWGHQMKKIVFHGDVFSLIIYWYERYENENDTIVFASSSRLVTLTLWPWKVNFKICPQVRSGQGQVMTQAGQYAHLPKRLDEPCRLASSARLYLHPVASYWRKTDCDLMLPQMTFQSSDLRLSVAPGSSQIWWVFVILNELGGLVSLSDTESIFIFSLRLIIERSENWPDLRSL